MATNLPFRRKVQRESHPFWAKTFARSLKNASFAGEAIESPLFSAQLCLATSKTSSLTRKNSSQVRMFATETSPDFNRPFRMLRRLLRVRVVRLARKSAQLPAGTRYGESNQVGLFSHF